MQLGQISVGEEEALPAPEGRRRVYYGWFMVPVALAGVIATSPGQTYGMAAFNDSFRAGLGLSHSQLTGAYMLGTLLAALPLSYVGRLMDRHGLRRTTTGVVLLLGVACAFMALTDGLAMLFAAFFFLRLLGPGALSLLSSSTLTFWFDRRLGTVEGLRHLGMPLAVAAVPSLNLYLIDRVGWRAAFAVLGLAVCALMLPLLALVFRNRPEDVGQALDGGAAAPRPDDPAAGEAAWPGLTFRQATRTRSFWIVLGVNSLWALVATAVTFNVVPIVQSRGLASADAAALLGIFSLSLAATHLVGGVLADRLPLHVLLTVATVCMAGTTAGLGALDLPGMAVACGLAMGVAQGLSTGLTSVICGRYFGRLHLGRIRGVYSTTTVAASSAGPFLVGLARDVTGGYELVLAVFTGLAAVGALGAVFATPPVRRPNEEQRHYQAV